MLSLCPNFQDAKRTAIPMKRLSEMGKKLLNSGLRQAANGGIQYLLPEYYLLASMRKISARATARVGI